MILLALSIMSVLLILSSLLLSTSKQSILNFWKRQRVRFLNRKSVPIEAYETLASLVQTLVQTVQQSLSEEREARRAHEERILALLQGSLLVAPTQETRPSRVTLEDEWATATSDAERQRILNERLGEIDFERDIDDIDLGI